MILQRQFLLPFVSLLHLLILSHQQLAFGLNVGRPLRTNINQPSLIVRLSAEKNIQPLQQQQEEEATLDALIKNLEEDEKEAAEVVVEVIKEERVVEQAPLPSFFNGYSIPSGGKGYSPFLENEDPTWMKKILFGSKKKKSIYEDLDEDGYADMARKKRSIFKKAVKFPFKVAQKALRRKPVEPGTLILVRHGESEWNKNKTFTGWADPDLTEQGRREIEHAARLLMAGGYKIDVAFTSRLKRAIRSLWILLQELDEVYLPVFKSWRLNERMYGALTGLSKIETAERLGQELVQQWRGSLRERPPAVRQRDPYWPGRERRYADLTADQIPMTESLLDCMERTEPLWENKIKYELSKGRNVLVVAHSNTLRGLVKTIDKIGDAEIQDVAIPTGIPIIYKFDKELNAIPPDEEDAGIGQIHMNALFLEKPGILKEALKREKEWAESVPGYDDTMSRHSRPMTSFERALYKLDATRALGEWASEFIDYNAPAEDDGNDGNFGRPIMLGGKDQLVEEKAGLDASKPVVDSADTATASQQEEQSQQEVLSLEKKKSEAKNESTIAPNIYSSPCVTSIPSATILGMENTLIRKDSVIVIIRHGKTQFNKLGLFTGWDDAPLADEGVEEAKEAGRLLKLHGFEFDVVYTSWLSRALETALYVMDEMDSLWLPIIKTWRLNERMYGELTGLSKQMVKQRHGEKQFMAWRRGYNVRPPPVSSFSKDYPGNDHRYQKYLKDRRYSFRETLIRSIERGELDLQRKLPKTESLKDCMERTVPYFKQRIAVDAVDQGKRVLISSSENAIRGLLMHLCEIPEEEITGLEIPNGLPLIYDVKSKCVKLLDDGTGRDPLKVHNFGVGAKYLFKPCKNEDGTPDDECSINYSGGKVSISLADQEALDYIKRGA